MSCARKDDLELFGKSVRALRKSRGLSQEAMALRAGLDRAYYGRIERGEMNLTLSKILMLADALSVRPQDLLVCFDSQARPENDGKRPAFPRRH